MSVGFKNNLNNVLGNQGGPNRNNLMDWEIANNQVLNHASKEASLSHALRYNTHCLEHDTCNHINRNQNNVRQLLESRIDTINDSRKSLSDTIAAIEIEIASMVDSERELEKALHAKKEPLEVAQTCLELRKGRVSVDDVDDDVEKSLNEEVHTIKYISKVLKNHLDHAREILRRMKSAKYTLEFDAKDKDTTIGLENKCVSHECGEKGPFKQEHGDPYTNLKQWKDFTDKNIEVAESERCESVNMRQVIANVLRLTADDLSVITLHVDKNFEIRIAEIETAKENLDTQLAATLEEMENLDVSIKSLDASLAATNEPMDYAQGQQHIRKQRPGNELCSDQLHEMLKVEVQDISAARAALKNNLEESKTKVKHLRQNEHRLRLDLEVKTKSLRIDSSCKKLRQKLDTRLN